MPLLLLHMLVGFAPPAVLAFLPAMKKRTLLTWFTRYCLAVLLGATIGFMAGVWAGVYMGTIMAAEQYKPQGTWQLPIHSRGG